MSFVLLPRLCEMPYLFSMLSERQVGSYIRAGERATWQKLAMVRSRMAVSEALRRAHTRLLHAASLQHSSPSSVAVPRLAIAPAGVEAAHDSGGCTLEEVVREGAGAGAGEKEGHGLRRR